MARKYTKEMLEPLVKESISASEVVRKLGKKPGSGGTYCNIKNKIKAFGIDTSHFRPSNKGKKFGSVKAKKWEEVLINRQNSDVRQNSHVLRRALMESGRRYECKDCGLKDLWNDKPLRLQVDHVSGIWNDDRPNNLEFRCPNCHSQTKNYCGNKGGTTLTTTEWKRFNSRHKEDI